MSKKITQNLEVFLSILSSNFIVFLCNVISPLFSLSLFRLITSYHSWHLGSYANWRGSRDPTVAVSADQERRKAMQLEKQGGEPAPRREEFEGFGGMKRRR